MSSPPSFGRDDWKSQRDRIDLAAVATSLLGPPPGRRGERGRKLWWNCPLHEDRNPSFCIDPSKPTWKCWGCGEHGDAASLLMRLERLTFPEAVRRLTGGPLGPASYCAAPRPTSPPPSDKPQGLPLAEALVLVEEAATRMWTPEGIAALNHLTRCRYLTHETIHSHRLGWTPRVELVTQDGRRFTARGIVIPWWDGDRLAMIKIRQPDSDRPKYVEAFRDRPEAFPAWPAAVGMPLVVVEGEFESLLLGQELADLAAVLTLGPASIVPEALTRGRLVGLSPWFIAHDSDPAGDKAAERWTSKCCRRVRPPAAFKDWCEVAQGKINLRRWWSDRLAGNLDPELFTWPELAAQRWGPALEDNELGITID